MIHLFLGIGFKWSIRVEIAMGVPNHMPLMFLESAGALWSLLEPLGAANFSFDEKCAEALAKFS